VAIEGGPKGAGGRYCRGSRFSRILQLEHRTTRLLLDVEVPAKQSRLDEGTALDNAVEEKAVMSHAQPIYIYGFYKSALVFSPKPYASLVLTQFKKNIGPCLGAGDES